MDLFKDFMNDTIDLDDLDVYLKEWKEMNVHLLFSKCMAEAGTSLFYMDFLHKNIGEGSQKKRVEILCEELTSIWYYVRQFEPDTEKSTLVNEKEYRLALMKWLYKFEDEVENQC